MDTFDKSAGLQARRPWVSPQLQTIGEIAEILKGGGGKLSPSPGDPGEPRKPTGGGA